MRQLDGVDLAGVAVGGDGFVVKTTVFGDSATRRLSGDIVTFLFSHG